MTIVLYIKSGGNILYALSTYVKKTQRVKNNLNKNSGSKQKVQNWPKLKSIP